MLCDAMKRQFANAFDMLEAAIPSFEARQWHSGRPPHRGPSLLTMHVLQCAEFYTSGDEGVWMSFGKPVWEISDSEGPSQRQLLDYLADCRSKTMDWIDAIGDHALGSKCANTEFSNNLELMAYALRHLQHHLGEICACQKQCGLPAANWK